MSIAFPSRKSFSERKILAGALSMSALCDFLSGVRFCRGRGGRAVSSRAIDGASNDRAVRLFGRGWFRRLGKGRECGFVACGRWGCFGASGSENVGCQSILTGLFADARRV